jgi:hypothetical protein
MPVLPDTYHYTLESHFLAIGLAYLSRKTFLQRLYKMLLRPSKNLPIITNNNERDM